MDEKTNNLIARKYLYEKNFGTVEAREFADWAVSELETGHETLHLKMLASAFAATRISDVESDFYRALDELDWSIPDEDDVVRRYADSVKTSIVGGEIDPGEGCVRLYWMSCYLNYPEDLKNWAGLYCADEEMPRYQIDRLIVDLATRELRGEFSPILPEGIGSFLPQPSRFKRFLQLFR